MAFVALAGNSNGGWNDTLKVPLLVVPALASSLRQCGRLESYLQCILYLVSYFSIHAGQASSFGGCMALVSYFDTARRPVSFLAKKPRFVTTSNLRSCHKAQAAPQTALLSVWAGTALLRDPLWRLQPEQPRARRLIDWAQSPCVACRFWGRILPRNRSRH